MKLPTLYPIDMARLQTQIFRGLNTKDKISDGEWNWEENVSSRNYPLFSERARRGMVAQLTRPQGMLAKDALAYVDNGTLYYNGHEVTLPTGVTLEATGEKQMISMGAYLLIWPDKVYVNTQDLTDCGKMGAQWESAGSISYQLCRLDGTAYNVPDANVGGTAPANPTNGTYWIDTSGDVHALKQYSSSQDAWTSIATVYVRIGSAGIGAAFAEYDGVTISGLAGNPDNPTSMEQVAALNGDKLVYARGDDYIVVAAGVLDQAWTQTEGTATVERVIPEMQYICEGENRVWGCYYGMHQGKMINEIYACALGDFKNWRKYMGLSTDSYTVSVGSDGAFTGAIHFQGYPHFFKENCLHKVWGTMPSNYRMLTTELRGVQAGSWRSMVVVNETLLYKSRADIVAFDGSVPAKISEALGSARYYDAAAGHFGGRYYISMRDEANEWHLFTYDEARELWHREDASHALAFEMMDDDLYMIDAGTGKLWALNGTQGEPEEPVRWSATSGIIGYEYENRKYLSRYNIRLKLGAGAQVRMYIEYDSNGQWKQQGIMQGGTAPKTFMLPVIPRRCDHMRLKLEGVGEVRIFSVARLLSVGGDGR